MAIAFDNASSEQSVSSNTTLTYSYTTGSITNGMLFVGVWNANSTSTPTVTYGGASMTLAKNQTWFFGSGNILLFALNAPATGANNVVVTYGTSQSAFRSSCASFSGVNQSVTPDATTSTTGSGTSTTLTLTTVANNCWTFAYCGSGNGDVESSGTGDVMRTNTGVQTGIFDSNGVVSPAGSKSMTVNISPSGQFGAVMASFAPAASAPSTAPAFFRMF